MKEIAYINSKIRKILVIDDSELLHRMYDLIFMRSRNNGVEILHAYQGQEGLNKLERHPDTDLIILDIHMPGMNGLEFLDHCKRERVFQDIPVLVTGTQGREEDTMKGLKAGARAYLTKPFQSENLYKVIGKMFNGTTQAQQSVVEYSL
jgi:two-component system, chemotaxis family, chemotaxis protein CheY